VAEEPTAGELQENHNLAGAAAANVSDGVDETTSEDSRQKLQETCERLFRQLQEVRRNVGRPEDLQVSHKHLLFFYGRPM